MQTPTAHKLSPQFRDQLEQAFEKFGLQPMTQSKTLADQVLKLSNFYLQNPGKPTPWSEPFSRAAYLTYFLPLNYIRLNATLREVERFFQPGDVREIWDFGSGAGTAQWALADHEVLSKLPLHAIERSKEAMDLNRELGPTANVTFNDPIQPGPMSLGLFSYSFLEMQNHLPNLEAFTHLLIVEPSTRECGRQLMQWRSKLMEKGFFPLAPCTHSEDCPLLVNSQKDWCHQRVHFAGPLWFLRVESHLPMRNRTLTYSYLLVSRTVQDSNWRGAARVIGDTMKENGKTRQMICRGSKREFLSWLHKEGPAQEIPHGALVKGTGDFEVRGPEVRVKGRLDFSE